MKRWWRRLMRLDDKNLDMSKSYGDCEATIGYHAGMNVTCGMRTNGHDLGYWHCSTHSPLPVGTRPKHEVYS